MMPVIGPTFVNANFEIPVEQGAAHELPPSCPFSKSHSASEAVGELIRSAPYRRFVFYLGFAYD